jgi:DNA-binding response OmpR family regulator
MTAEFGKIDPAGPANSHARSATDTPRFDPSLMQLFETTRYIFGVPCRLQSTHVAIRCATGCGTGRLLNYLSNQAFGATMKIAVFTRNAGLFGFISQSFEPDRAVCHRFSDEVMLARAAYRDEFHAVLVDGATGISPLRPLLARRACYADRRAPVIFMGLLDDRASVNRALDAGADDVVLAPIEARELVLRVHLAIRRFGMTRAMDDQGVIEHGVYRLDRNACVVHVNGEEVRLTPREFAIAWLLFSRYGEYVSRRQIAGAVWSSSEDIVGRTLEQHIYKLRKKLELHGSHGTQLRTMYAHGYRIETSESGAAHVATESIEKLRSRLPGIEPQARAPWPEKTVSEPELELDDAW